jgi:penicillin-binding protein 1C
VAAALFLSGTWLLRSFWLPWLVDDPGSLLTKRFSSGGAWLDRQKNPLRLYADDNGDFFCYSPLASHSSNIFNALLTAEDRGFFEHPGFDAVAIGRAFWQNLTNLKVVSGASTISQQLIRILKPRPRTISSKIVELFEALRLEDAYSKNEILEFYVNTVPMFGNVRGFYLASLLLFKKTPDLLSLAESATLAALVQSPGRLSPFNAAGNKRLRKRRDWIIREMLALGFCRADQAQEAISTNIPEYRSQLPFKAPHFCDLLTQSRGKPRGNQITIISQLL